MTFLRNISSLEVPPTREQDVLKLLYLAKFLPNFCMESTCHQNKINIACSSGQGHIKHFTQQAHLSGMQTHKQLVAYTSYDIR